MSKKATLPLPYPEGDFKAAQQLVNSLRTCVDSLCNELKKAELVIDEMAKKNFEAETVRQHKEEEETAQVLTKEMRAVLEKMQGGRDIHLTGHSKNRTGTFTLDGKKIHKRLFDRLMLAKFVSLKFISLTECTYRITDLGVLALTGKKITIQEPTK